jgi:eukaryotic-like serine/threonine-protein kinase
MSSATHGRSIAGYEIVRQVPDKQREVYLAHRGSDTNGVVLVVSELDGTDASRLEHEARRCLEIESPAFSNVVDFFVEDGRHVVGFEHVEGTSLHRLMRYIDEQDERLGDGAVLHIGVGLLAALNVAHSAKTDDGKAAPIIHGQLGPHQVLISWEGVVKVMGFGLSVMFEKAGVPPSWLMPFYAPEVRDGRPHTSRANVYAAGAMLWTLLARQPLPENGSRPRPLRKVRPDLPPSVTFPLDRALEPDAGKRISAKALQVGLTRAIEDADREELRWAMEVCRVRCTIEEEFLPQESLPPSNSAIPISSSHSLASSPPDSDAPTGVTDQQTLLDKARILGPLPWERDNGTEVDGDAENLSDSARPIPRASRRPRPATRRRLGRHRDGEPPAPPRPPGASDRPSSTHLMATIPAPAALDEEVTNDGGTLEAGAVPEVEEARPATPSEGAPVSFPAVSSTHAPSSVYPGSGQPHPSQYPPGMVYASGPPASYAPGSVYPFPMSGHPGQMMPGLGYPVAMGSGLPKFWIAAIAVTALGSFLVGVLVSSGLALRFAEPRPVAAPPAPVPTAPAPPVVTATAAPAPAPEPAVTAAPTPAPSAEPVAEVEPAASAEVEEEPPEPVSTEPIVAMNDEAAALPAHRAHLLVHTDIKDAHVYVHGRVGGATEETIEVDCGMKFVRLGRSPNTGWLEPGRAFEIPCRTFVTITIEPRPMYWPKRQFLK